jgi:DNA-directed RNA polymerase omega subunit
MARVTIEDCIDKVSSRFELVTVAAQRAKAITSGAPLTIERDGEKNTVLALREIAVEKVGVEHLRESLIQSLQKPSEFDDLPETEDTTGKSLLEEEIEDMAAITPQQAPAETAEAGMESNLFTEENLDVDD